MRRGLVFGVWLIFVLFVAVFGVLLNVPLVKGDSGTVYIRADGSIDPLDAPVSTLDNVTYTLTGNVTSSSDGIVVERDNIIIDGDGYAIQDLGAHYGFRGIDLTGRSNVTIKNTKITGFSTGIYLYGCLYISIFDSSITQINNILGIYLESSSNNNIVNNSIAACTNGVGVYGYYNRLSGNNITTDNGCGVVLGDSDNVLCENNIAKSSTGVHFYGGNNQNVTRNNITGNYYGIVIYSSTGTNHRISENNLINNDVGVRVYYASYHVIYHNNFINNTQQAYVDPTHPYYTNIWDDGYPFGGNYWSDYVGVDSDNDGIGDSWYEINSNNIDHYPLMGMFSDFEVTSEHHIQTVCNSSMSDFQFNGTAISFDVTGDNGTAGFCRICIPTALMNATYTVFVNGTEVSSNLLPCSNETYSYLYFNYTHSTQEVIIIPEFPSSIIMPLFMVATIITAAIHKRKNRQKSLNPKRNSCNH